jgi:hypothetical protein
MYREQIMKYYPKTKKLLVIVSVFMLWCVSASMIQSTYDSIQITDAVFEKRNVLFAKFQQSLVQILLRNMIPKVENSHVLKYRHSHRYEPLRLTRQAAVQ